MEVDHIIFLVENKDTNVSLVIGPFCVVCFPFCKGTYAYSVSIYMDKG